MHQSLTRRSAAFVLPWLAVVALVAASGCATTALTANRSDVGSRRLAKPAVVLVQDFAASPSDMYEQSSYEPSAPSRSVPSEQVELGRRIGREVAVRVAERIRAMGIDAEAPGRIVSARPGDLVLRGFFQSIDEGNAAKRMVVGFGSGKASLTTVVEGYLMTERGLRPLGSATVDSTGGKKPGVLLPIVVTAATANPIGLAVGGVVHAAGEISGRSRIEGEARRTADTIADRLDERFREQGWIR
jgi:hypothetical protein